MSDILTPDTHDDRGPRMTACLTFLRQQIERTICMAAGATPAVAPLLLARLSDRMRFARRTRDIGLYHAAVVTERHEQKKLFRKVAIDTIHAMRHRGRRP